MSAYGKISAPTSSSVPLPLVAYNLPNQKRLLLFPLKIESTPPSLITYLYSVFKNEIDGGRTYPQESCETQEEFTNYFFSGQVVVGIVVGADEAEEEGILSESDGGMTLEETVAGRDWEKCVGGFYYIKPNYPGRSSHNCNGGFMVPPASRGLKIGVALGKSYLIYAPMLGYRASVFNLVFQNNQASLRIWDQLGFSRVGLIPEAGLLKKADGSGEEFVDAVVVYKRF